ncbi:MAG: hypothetical protein KA712_04170 [Myxococcales bacterium]|nr:hypothetical protein [Myxococcales bacterium]
MLSSLALALSVACSGAESDSDGSGEDEEAPAGGAGGERGGSAGTFPGVGGAGGRAGDEAGGAGGSPGGTGGTLGGGGGEGGAAGEGVGGTGGLDSPGTGGAGPGGMGGGAGMGGDTIVDPPSSFTDPDGILFATDFSGTVPAEQLPWHRVWLQHPEIVLEGFALADGVNASPGQNDRFAFTAKAAASEASAAEAVTAARYATVRFSVSPAFRVNLNGGKIEFWLGRQASQTAGPLAVFTSVGGFAPASAVSVTEPVPGAGDGLVKYTVALPASGYEGLLGPVEIRIYPLGQAGQTPSVSLAGFVLRGQVAAAPGPGPARRSDVGTNLGHIREFEKDSPFLDKFKQARPWITRPVGAMDGFDRRFSEQIPHDAHGWPTQVPFTPPGEPPQIVHTLISTPRNGPHALLFEGKGKIVVKGPGVLATVDAQGGSGRFDVIVNKRDNGYKDSAIFYVEIHATDPADHLRNFKFLHTRHLAIYERDVFEPTFVSRLAGINPLRFMDWGAINGQTISSWAQRPTPQTYSQATEEGVALEHMIALANATKADAWVNVPHLANDAFVREMAKMLQEKLHTAAKIYVEYSNETWNTEFEQGKYVRAQGKTRYPSLSEYQAHHKFATYKQVRVWELFKEVFGNAFEARVRRPLGGQAAGRALNELRLDFADDADINPQGIKVQGLALAPYFGKFYRNADVAGGVPSTAKILQDARDDLNQKRNGQWSDAKQLAARFGVSLWAVEAGQTIRAIEPGSRESQVFVDNAFAANRSPQMYTLYVDYLAALKNAGFNLTMQFVFCGGWSKWGTWGGLEYLDQPLPEAPKHRALYETIFGN